MDEFNEPVIDVIDEFPAFGDSDENPGDIRADETEISDVVEEDFRDNEQTAPVSPDVSEVVPEPLPPEDDSSSVPDILDSFLTGVLAGVSANAGNDSESPVEPVVEAPSAPPECVGIETFALSPITSASGLKGILLEVIGPYDNVVTQYKYQQANNSYYTYVNEITPDYPWIASAFLFIAMVVSLFGLLKRSFSSWLR